MQRKAIVALAMLSAASMVLVACGGGSSADNSNVSDNKIVIGVITDESGVYADLAGKGSVEAAKLAVADFKAKYGDKALTSDISVVDADHQDKPDVATNEAQQMYGQQGVDAIFDVPTSSAMLAVAKVAAAQKKIFMDTGGGSTAISNDDCNAYSFHYGYDTYMLAAGTAKAVVDNGGDSWFITYPNYAFGQDMEKNFSAAVKKNGGTVVDSVPSPFPNSSQDYSSILLQAKQAKPKILGAMQAGGDLVSLVKQYNTFNLKGEGIGLSTGLLFLSDIMSIGAANLSDTMFTTSWYWNMDEKSQAFAKKFGEAFGGKMPTSDQASVYSAVLQYLEATQRAGTDNSDKVVKEMEGYTFDDMYARNATIRAKDHVLSHDVYLAKVVDPGNTTSYDVEKVVSTISGKDAFQPEAESTCSL